MGQLLYMRSVVDRNVVMRCIPVLKNFPFTPEVQDNNFNTSTQNIFTVF